MALVNFTNLDFDQIKVSIRDYLRANSNFTDYDFEGSNLSILIDTLAYNTYISSYNANMISNEVFIDSATLRENVVSLAKLINYVPRSRISSKANISFFVDTTRFTTNPISITLNPGLVCSSTDKFQNENYTFCIPSQKTVPVVNGIAFFNDVDIFEGVFIQEFFTVSSSNKNQRFILSNLNIDTNSILVSVRNNAESTVIRKFQLCENFCDVDGESKVFFIQEIEDQRYELIFGDNVLGKKLDNTNIIEVSYIISVGGESGNGISNFTFNGRLTDNNGRAIASGISLISANSSSQGGKEIESIESIKKFAPRLYSSQNRAVTTTDYETIVSRIYPETESISVFGGEELNPPKYGKVFITIKPKSGEYVSDTIKNNLKDQLRKYSVAGIVPEFLDLKYLYIEFDSKVYYNSNLTLNTNSLQSIVRSNIETYSNTELNKYGSRFKYSKFLKLIDDTNDAITSNITRITLRRDLKIPTNQFVEYEICFGNEFHIGNVNGYNIKTSGFKIAGINDTLYLTDIPNVDKKTGSIVYFKIGRDLNPTIVRNNVGKIDYVKGEIILYPINILSTSKTKFEDPIIEIQVTPKSNDVIGLQDLFLQLDTNNSIVDMVSDTMSSGSDLSGSRYIASSSYNNGNLVRS
jgi:hypothetical protein